MLMLVRFVCMIRTVVLQVLVIRLVSMLVAVIVFVRMTVLDVSMTVFVVMGMSVFALRFHRFPSSSTSVQHCQK